MRFSLVYQGDLGSRKKPIDKARIRKEFDPQLRHLWQTPPLNDSAHLQDINHKPNDCYVGRSVGSVEYVPLITDRLSLRAELDILFLSADSHDGLVRHGDIDNRLKTLFDALGVPTQNQAQADEELGTVDGRRFCLLDDDRLISKVSVRNERWLNAAKGSNEALVVIDVRPVAFRGLVCNIGIAG